MTGAPPVPNRRLADRFAALRAEGRAALIPFVMAGDPNPEQSLALLRALPGAGADIVELGMPFSDPMADGPVIQAAGRRALDAGQNLAGTLDLVTRFRAEDNRTPLVLMGYYNPIYRFGTDRFLARARAAGVDGLIVVDLPPDMDAELCLPAMTAGISFIRLVAPTTDAARLPRILRHTSGFLYYVSITGITGGARPDATRVGEAVSRIRAATALPVCVGFGIRSAGDAAAIGRVADGVVVGAALVKRIADNRPDPVPAATAFVRELAAALPRPAGEPS